MKIKTSELTGAALDWAVAKSKGITLYRSKEGKWMTADYGQFNPRHGAPWWHPSTNWGQGGPIIEREKIDLTAHLNYWEAKLWANREVINGMPLAIATATLRSRRVSNSICMHEPMALVAAMRCYVASKLGDEVEIPTEITA
jgi:hypothetical protein